MREAKLLLGDCMKLLPDQCVNTGRGFIGVEKDPSYFDVACNRIRGAEGKTCLE